MTAWGKSLLTVSLAVGSLGAQQPSFRAGTDLVHVEVTVFDKAWQFLPGLSARDFTVLENGKPRPIVAFSAVEIPPGPRLVLIVIDEAMPAKQHDGARRLARAVVDTLGSNDQAAVVFARQLGEPAVMRADHEPLLATINAPFPAPSDGRCLVDAVARVADRVASVTGWRKQLHVIGPLFKSAAPSGNDGACAATPEDTRGTINRTTDRTHVAIDGYDPSDLRRGFDPQMAFVGTQFILGFEPANRTPDIARRIQVKVKHRGVHAMRWVYCTATCR